MDLLKVIGVALGGILLAWGLARSISLLIVIGFLIMAGSVLWMSMSGYVRPRSSEHRH